MDYQQQQQQQQHEEEIIEGIEREHILENSNPLTKIQFYLQELSYHFNDDIRRIDAIVDDTAKGQNGDGSELDHVDFSSMLDFDLMIDDLSHKLPKKMSEEEYYSRIRELEERNEEATRRLAELTKEAEDIQSKADTLKNKVTDHFLESMQIQSNK